jgi:DNA polymerase
MVADSLQTDAALLHSALSWWEMAGVDLCMDELPRRWLESPAPPMLVDAVSSGEPGKPRAASASAPAARARIDTLDALIGHLLTDPELVEAGPPERRIAASGHPDAPLMVLIDVPDEGDAARGALLTGESARLFDAMLAAMGKTRADCYIAALCPGAPAGGLLPSSALPRYEALARDHAGFAGSESLWLMGSAAIRAILQVDALPLPKGLQLFNHGGRKKAVIAGHAPRFLLRQPKHKAQVWAAMQALMTGNKA